MTEIDGETIPIPGELIVHGENKSCVPFGFRTRFSAIPCGPERRTRDAKTIEDMQRARGKA